MCPLLLLPASLGWKGEWLSVFLDRHDVDNCNRDIYKHHGKFSKQKYNIFEYIFYFMYIFVILQFQEINKLKKAHIARCSEWSVSN